MRDWYLSPACRNKHTGACLLGHKTWIILTFVYGTLVFFHKKYDVVPFTMIS